ncbi:MAG: S-layer homology domain-containing protein, partial [Candidatus Peregrinibacteria bacterium]
MKKFLISAICAFLVFSQVAMASFSDVPANHHYRNSIQWMQDNGVVNGYSDGTFRSDQSVTRAEFLKMLYETVGMDGHDADLPFPDISENAWYTPYVKEAYATGVIVGYPDGTFKPNNNINFAEAAKIVGNGFFNVNALYGDGGNYHFCLANFENDYVSEWYWKYFYVTDNFCLIP